jgi:hypothetical protein
MAADVSQFKLNDRGIISLAYNSKINSGFTFGIGASLDSQKLNEAGHKVRLCIGVIKLTAVDRHQLHL